jgi:hypothetical protein
LTGLQWGGVVAGAAAVVALGVTAGFGLEAMTKNNSTKGECSPTDPDFCSAAGRHDRDVAITSGNIATGSAIAFGALGVTSAVLFLIPSHREQTSASPPAGSIDATPLVGSQFIGGVLRGRF